MVGRAVNGRGVSIIRSKEELPYPQWPGHTRGHCILRTLSKWIAFTRQQPGWWKRSGKHPYRRMAGGIPQISTETRRWAIALKWSLHRHARKGSDCFLENQLVSPGARKAKPGYTDSPPSLPPSPCSPMSKAVLQENVPKSLLWRSRVVRFLPFWILAAQFASSSWAISSPFLQESLTAQALRSCLLVAKPWGIHVYLGLAS